MSDPEPSSPVRTSRFGFWGLVGAMVVALWVVAFRVDLTPHVEGDFFFSTEDPAYQASREIGERFVSSPQLLINAAADDIADPVYLDRIDALTVALAALPGIRSVQSLTNGPAAPTAVAGSPLWRRLLLTDDPRSTQLVAFLEEEGTPGLVEGVERVLAEHEGPGFALDVSGVPYVVEQIRRYLRRDLRVFSVAALLVFGLVILVVYRSLPLVAGTLLSCVGASLLTLTVLHLLGTPIGVLTANIATIVFVLTLSHTVFLTSNWRRLRGELGREAAVAAAGRVTFTASFWCMVAAFLGFGSLLLANAKPMRELGVSGMVGTAVAIVVAYGFYPAFLHRPRVAPIAPAAIVGRGAGVGSGRGPAVIAVICVVAAFGLPAIDTDPSLFSYFDADSELRTGLELIDANGGSSPLYIVVADPEGRSLDEESVQPRLTVLQEALEAEPSVGVSLSLPVLVAEARLVPFVTFWNTEQILDLLEADQYEQIARAFVSEDRLQASFFLRMRETGRVETRRAVVDRLTAEVRAAGLEPVLVGGLYDLQGKLGELVASSLGRELGGLLLFFVVVAGAVSRRPDYAAAMVISLAAVPVILLGTVGFLGQPVDVVSAPGANVAIALGIDAMIHLMMSVRRQRQAGHDERESWVLACAEQRPAIVGAMSILATGFGIFVLSSFPPTRRFGVLVAAGALSSAVMALVVLPYLATLRARITRAL